MKFSVLPSPEHDLPMVTLPGFNNEVQAPDGADMPPESETAPSYNGHRYGLRLGRLVLGFGPETPMPEAELPPQRAFQPDTITHPLMREQGRSLQRYEDILRFNRNELSGLTVLDLGTGPTARFARELRDSGIASRVISLSPDFPYNGHGARVREVYDGPLVAGLGQALPVRSGSIDRVYALHVGEHLRSYEEVTDFVREIARTLRAGGEGRIGPLTWSIPDVVMDSLAKQGVEVHDEPISLEIFRTRAYDSSGMALSGYQQHHTIVLRKSV